MAQYATSTQLGIYLKATVKMPELPEVETTRRGIEPYLTGHTVLRVDVRERRLRWPIPKTLDRQLSGEAIVDVRRRAKYLLLETKAGTAILHLGMSGSLRILDAGCQPEKHDHYDLVLDSGRVLRFNDPRRFGCLLWAKENVNEHPLLAGLGPEPLGNAFDGKYLYQCARGRKIAIKSFIMDSKIVVGIGNIYASEALFRAGIHPLRAAGRVSLTRMIALVSGTRSVLDDALRQGGTTLRDFVGSDGLPGYFSQDLAVYDRDGEPCIQCGTAIRSVITGQRSTYYCVRCQK